MSGRQLLARLVEAAGGPSERGYVLALDGDELGELPSRLELPGVTYGVARIDTELGLRRLLWKAGGAPFVAVVPQELAQRLPVDLVRRARGERVHGLDITEILSAVLGVHVMGVSSPEAREVALAHLDALRARIKPGTLPTSVDTRLLDELLLEVVVGRRLREAPPGALLGRWVEERPTWSEAERVLLRRNLPAMQGTAGRLLAWALAGAEPHARLRELCVRGLLLEIPGDASPALWGVLSAAWEDAQVALPRAALREAVVRLAREAVAEMDASDALVLEAEGLARQLMPRERLAESTLLPLGLDVRTRALAERAAAGETIDPDEVSWLGAHRAAATREAEIAVVCEMARLSRWLQHSEPAEDRTAGSHARRYAEDGAFADWAAARLRQGLSATTGFHEAANMILERWRARRNGLNEAFAHRLADGYEAALHDEGVVALQRTWSEIVLPRLVEAQGKDGPPGVFVVILDGCSYPVFLDLLEAMERDASIGLHVELEAADRASRPGLAPLPTITSHARGALIQGRIPKDALYADTAWTERERKTDPARFKANPELKGRTRRLFLKGDLRDGGAELVKALEDPELEVVAAVFNAVDDRIGSADTGSPLSVRPAEIAGLLPALRKALFSAGGSARRHVLLVADHGHTPFVSTALRVGAGATPRYAALEQDEAPPDGFIEIDLEGLGGDLQRAAFAWRMSVYRGMPQLGFHGGCALEEMVVPMAWLAVGGVPAKTPDWWAGDVAVAARTPRRSSAPVPVPVEAERAPADKAAASPVATRAAAGTGPTRFPTPPHIPGLPDDTAAGLTPEQLVALRVLAVNGKASVTELSQALGTRRGRVAGLMTTLGRRLHATGAPLFESELLPDGEPQYRWTGPRKTGP